MIEGMLRLNPKERMTCQDAAREYHNIGTTKMYKDKKQAEEKLAQSEKDRKKAEEETEKAAEEKAAVVAVIVTVKQ